MNTSINTTHQRGARAVPEAALNAETENWLRRARALGAALHDAELPDQRTSRVGVSDQLFTEFGDARVDDVTITEHRVGENNLLVLEIRALHAATHPAAYVYFHGGAFWHGSVREKVNIGLMAERARRSGTVVFAVEYRLAPEHPYPAARSDGEAVLAWLRASAHTLKVDPHRIVLGGISAGASIATALAKHIGPDGGITGLLLEVPAIDLRDDGYWAPEFAELNGLNSPGEMAVIYAPHTDPGHPGVSPALETRLAHFPATHVMTAEIDPLRPAGEVLASALRRAGVAVTATRHLGAVHGSIGLTARDPIAIGWQDEACTVLRRLSAPNAIGGKEIPHV